MRGFLMVSGLLAGGIAVAFILALLTAKDPVERLPPALIQGAELRDAEAQEAFNSWMSGLPAEPATPLRLKLQLTGTGKSSDNSAAGSFEFSMDLALADAQRGRAELDVSLLQPGQPPIRGEGVMLADGNTMWLWGRLDGMDVEGQREGAYSVKQSIVEEAWATLRARFPELLRMAKLQGMGVPPTPPSSVLMLLHPAWMSRGLAVWPCSSLRLEGESLHARFRPGAEFAGVELLAIFDVNTGLVRQIEAAAGAAVAGAPGLRVQVTPLDAKLPDGLLLLPADLKALDVSLMAPMVLQLLDAGLGFAGAASDTEF